VKRPLRSVKIRRQRFRLAAAAMFFCGVGVLLLAALALSFGGSFLWMVLVGR
jgi:fatty acid desaturase